MTDQRTVPSEPTDEMVDAALRSTAAFLDIKGSQLTVNREKMRRRYKAMLAAAPAADAGEVERLRAWLECIERILNDEIVARFGGHSSKSADELGRQSRVYGLLQIPRDLARRALAGDPFIHQAPHGEDPKIEALT